ncbi:LysR family transcriptional regulator [Thalassobius sp. Cn5-15]|uniref:LysR family transcriptional regulator n=1 Tax=Thalassobius sp. Cn5-15 TaxID=2917763 RepID=UPI001EF1E1D5|nr:LysR family transcriptional regulator [Thalassobius sp. Cn5-15]MCG7494243.1 LysR family transcriptional regulator [Thalassobius sp. Cn5-15]
MVTPRRFLPSINSLMALEAVDRLGSATAAAQDLSLTHSAVSRQLKVLEEQLGVTLFVRDGKGLKLTLAGETYAQSVRSVLKQLAQASLKVKATGSRSSLNLAVLPTFGMYWLTPRLRDFCGAHPEVQINQATRVSPFDFQQEPFDAALHFGSQNWPGVHYLPLAAERVMAVCAPDFAPALPLSPEQLLELPLLHLESRPGAWEAWFAQHDLIASRLRGMLFDQFTNMTEAVAEGFGAALLPEYLARAEIARGRVVPAHPGLQEAEGTYYLVWPKTGGQSTALEQLINWLERDVSETMTDA